MKKAKVTATLSQLKEIGIDEDIVGKIVDVYEIDKFSGMYAPCSRIVVDATFNWLKDKGLNVDYIFPTRWLDFNVNES